jgi:hypothetical protein
MSIDPWVDLTCHPLKRCPTVCALRVLLRRSTDSWLRMTFRVDGEIPRIRVAPRNAASFGRELWRHTCFEAFIALEGCPAYHEFNFAPSGEWAVYAFRRYRDGEELPDDLIRPQISLCSTDDRLEVETLVPLAALSPMHPRACLRIGLAAVIETSEGVSHWALRHPAGKPDFHHAHGFAILLAPSGSQ